MLNRPKATSMNTKKPLPFWLLVGTSCLAMAGLLGTISTRTVQADAGLPRPAAAPPVAVNTPTPQMTAAPKRHGSVLRGIASWYGEEFDGRKTASGETFSMDEMTACTPSLPFGTEVRVVNLRNHKSVVVRITDRAELVKGRVIDLSYAAADKLNMTKTGIARVSIEVLSLGHPGA
jgi:rare lipoprotein A